MLKWRAIKPWKDTEGPSVHITKCKKPVWKAPKHMIPTIWPPGKGKTMQTVRGPVAGGQEGGRGKQVKHGGLFFKNVMKYSLWCCVIRAITHLSKPMDTACAPQVHLHVHSRLGVTAMLQGSPITCNRCPALLWGAYKGRLYVCQTGTYGKSLKFWLSTAMNLKPILKVKSM